MSDLNLRPVMASSRPSSRPVPTPSILRPWQFEYAPSPNGQDQNLLIMFHGLGDTKTPFFNLAKNLNLPSTAVLSLQAPDPVPLLDHPSWSWYNTFTPLFEPLPNPNPTKALPNLRNLLETLISPEVGWDLDRIHLFGWGQGATMALELALDVGKNGLDFLPAESTQRVKRRRLGSVISVCAGLISHPSSSLDLQTPICSFTRLAKGSAVQTNSLGALRRAFEHVDVVQGEAGNGEDMPRGRGEWEGVMRFWGKVLSRGEEGWKGSGEVFEVVR